MLLPKKRSENCQNLERFLSLTYQFMMSGISDTGGSVPGKARFRKIAAEDRRVSARHHEQA